MLERDFVALAEVQEAFRVGERDVLQALREIRTDMVTDLMDRLRSGKITARNMDSQRRSAFKRARRARAMVAREVTRIGETGMTHVADELGRQVS